MSDVFLVKLILGFIIIIGVFLVWNMADRPKLSLDELIYLFKKFWIIGTTKPLQRIGIIFLLIGLVSFFAWDYENTVFRFSIYYGFYWSYRFPDRYDSWFYHLHVYLIPIGLMTSWGYPFLQKIKKWVFKNK
ncbi:hypothetical protein NCZ17_00865 [Acinetobacter modestus]|uniref:hypothetical protein n=1 Tax=Acinetobacter modestus TaxID=1776740 RepID=UPI0020307D1E|nr:hypothetical protein [Acinetobacter modestus]MCM1957922.1 hypothetical protein [Acinetobacter modestus]